MTINKNANRQDELIAQAVVNFADLAGLSGVYAPAVDLPPNAIVTGGGLGHETPFNSVTSDNFAIGQQVSGAGAVANTYAASGGAGGAYVPIVPTNKKNTKAATVGLVWTGVGAIPTQGQVRLIVKYIIDNRAHSTEG
jgi:hypothetical protein